LQSRTRDALALQIAANLLNSALENEGETVDAGGAMTVRASQGFAAVTKLIADMNAGAVDALFIDGANPADSLPAAAGFTAAAKKVPLVISVTDRDDETAQLADFVLPDHHWLENWGDAHPRAGVASIQQPAIAPIHSTRAFQDALLTWIRGGVKASGLASRVAAAANDHDWHGYLMANWREGGNAGSEEAWESVLRDGLKKGSPSRGGARSFRSAAVGKIPAYKAAGTDVMLSLYETIAMGDGRYANNAWLQEMPDPVSTVAWDNFLNVGPALAEKLKVKTHDVVEFKVGDLTAELPVVVQPGLHPQTVSAAIGYGRTNAGKVGTGVGVNLYPFVAVENGRAVYAGMPVTLRKTGKYYALAQTQWHHASENRPVINDITLAEFKANPGASNHTDPHLRLDPVPTIWPKHEYKGHRWGMSIDLNTCMGCNACVIACQAENNVPVVGRDNVRVSREMHWIRIDRYYAGDPSNPQVVFQPMLCQHCENAPCETVCPVLATVHNDEGLNIQAYNRCVGTRYCSNNCPYKVRRFNFFDHWKSYEGPMNMAWNPDVTVRTRGIMEKCTFCVQRIQSAKDDARIQGRRIREEDLKTACQQTCPTDAIVFGDVNDPDTRVSKLADEKRAFRVLEVLNTRPSISYLSKVRNVEASASHADEGGSTHGGEHAPAHVAPEGARPVAPEGARPTEEGAHHG
jgi:molybdopterin-containing oxidoreductase family iron-sulfur binding subunit